MSIFLNSINILLQKIATCDLTHARFLNTLAFMELCGAQKLAHAMSFLKSSTCLLEHAAEEYRHAFYLRKLANKLADEPFEHFDETNTFAIRQSKAYIQSLNRHVCLLLKKHDLYDLDQRPTLPYLVTTYAIEQRALPFYRLYQQMIDENNIPISLKSVISEEEDHLSSMQSKLAKEQLPASILEKSLLIENQLFERWLKKLLNELV